MIITEPNEELLDSSVNHSIIPKDKPTNSKLNNP